MNITGESRDAEIRGERTNREAVESFDISHHTSTSRPRPPPVDHKNQHQQQTNLNKEQQKFCNREQQRSNNKEQTAAEIQGVERIPKRHHQQSQTEQPTNKDPAEATEI
ncbi:hypothetical protein ACHQM5_014142 [Ranunculus cassubicifolius]